MSERAAERSIVFPVRAPGAVAVVLLALIGLMALIGPFLVPYDPIATNPPIALRPPSSAPLFGTDQLGRDVFSRVIVSARVDLGIAFAAVIVTLVIGTALGAAAGWAGGW